MIGARQTGAMSGGVGCALPTPPDIAPVCRAPITYTGQEAIQRDIANFKAALASQGLETGYLNSVAPGSGARFGNEHYENDEELIYACGTRYARSTRRSSTPA